MLTRVQQPMVVVGLVACLASGVGLAENTQASEKPKTAGRFDLQRGDLRQQAVGDKPVQPIEGEDTEEVQGIDGVQDEAQQPPNESDRTLEAQESEDFPVKSGAKRDGMRAKKPARGLRLPRYFAGLVDQQQRLQIQEIQMQFRTRIAELEEQLKLLQQEEAEALEQVLTDSQRKLLQKKRSQAVAIPSKSVQRPSKERRESDQQSKTGAMKDHPDPTEPAETVDR